MRQIISALKREIEKTKKEIDNLENVRERNRLLMREGKNEQIQEAAFSTFGDASVKLNSAIEKVEYLRRALYNALLAAGKDFNEVDSFCPEMSC